MAVKLIPAVCPQCGSKIKLPEGTKRATCQFCGTDILLDKGEVVIIHKEDVEGKAARLLSVAEKYWDTLKFQDMHDACKQLLELDSDNPVGWLYNAISANGIGNMVEFERSMDEARKLSAKKMGTAESKFFAQKVDWAYTNLANNVGKYVAAGDMRNVASIGHMMVWMKPESPLGWFYNAYAIAPPEVAHMGTANAKVLKDQTDVAHARAQERSAAIKQAWLLYDKKPNDEFSKRFKEAVGKQFNALRWGQITALIAATAFAGGSLAVAAVIAVMSLGTLGICALVLVLLAILIGAMGLSNAWFLLTKNERNFI